MEKVEVLTVIAASFAALLIFFASRVTSPDASRDRELRKAVKTKVAEETRPTEMNKEASGSGRWAVHADDDSLAGAGKGPAR